jgi:16S rRNA (cytosine1402-N4)-methyltransferase
MVNEWSWETLTTIFKGWGEEPRAYKVAQAIVAAREISPIRTTGQLVKIIESVIPRIGKVHPATRVFQALRIAVNREIEILEPACTDALTLLSPGSRLCVITFHSGEDRVMKQLFNEWAEASKGVHLTRKVIQAERDEKLGNPRARSAKLRVFEKA